MPVSFQRCCNSRMVQRLVRIDQLLELLDDPEFRREVLLLLGLQPGDELVAAAAVLPEQLLELHLGAVHGGRELLLGAPLLNEAAARSLHLGAAQPVEGDLQRLHVAPQRLHGLFPEHLPEQGHQLLLALSGETVLGRGSLRRQPFGGLLLGRGLVQFEPGAPGRQRGVLVRKVHLHLLGRILLLRGFHGLRRRPDAGAARTRRILLPHGLPGGNLSGDLFGGSLRHGISGSGLPGGIRPGFCAGGLRDRGFRRSGHFGIGDAVGRLAGSDHIFSRRADLLLGSRKVRFFSSHFSTRFLARREAGVHKSRKYTYFSRYAEGFSGKFAIFAER